MKDQYIDYPCETTFTLGLYTLCRVKNKKVTVKNAKMASNSRIFAILHLTQPSVCTLLKALLAMSSAVINSYTKQAAKVMHSNYVVILDLMSLVFL